MYIARRSANCQRTGSVVLDRPPNALAVTLNRPAAGDPKQTSTGPTRLAAVHQPVPSNRGCSPPDSPTTPNGALRQGLEMAPRCRRLNSVAVLRPRHAIASANNQTLALIADRPGILK